MTIHKGVNARKADKSICQVVGCNRTAIYRNAPSAQIHGPLVAGYCLRHKSFAVSTAVDTYHVDEKWGERWEPLCSDPQDHKL